MMPFYLLTWFYNQRASTENLIKEANNDAGLAKRREYPFTIAWRARHHADPRGICATDARRHRE